MKIIGFVVSILTCFPANLLAFPAGQGTPADGCAQEEMEACMRGLQDIVQNEELAFATTKEQLDTACEQLNVSLNCIDSHVSRCFSFAVQVFYFRMMSEQRNAFQYLCTAGETQDAYLAYAACYRNVTLEATACGQQYRQMTESVRARLNGQISDEEYLRRWCCEHEDFLQCFQQNVAQCGEDASQIARPVMNLMNGSQQQRLCTQFTRNYQTCQQDQSA